MHRADAGGARAFDVGADGVADVQGPIRRHARCFEGDGEDGGIRLGDADGGRVDHDRHRHARPRADLADSFPGQTLLQRAVGVRHDRQGHTGGVQGPQSVQRTGHVTAPDAVEAEGDVEFGHHVGDTLRRRAHLAGVRLLVSGPDSPLGGGPVDQGLNTCIMRPVEQLRFERAVNSGSP
jgi:hypothetical protein